MAKSDLLKEAIADAKAVKETALANAKIALQEAFAPRIQNMLSAKLSEDLDEQDDMEDDMGADMADDMGQDVGDVSIDTTGDGEMDFEGDIFADLEGGGEAEAMAPDAGADDMAAGEEEGMDDEEMTAEYNEGMHEDEMDADEGMHENDLGLDEIISELEEEMPDEDGLMADGMHEDEMDADEGMHEGMHEDEMDADEGMHESIDDIINEILAEEEMDADEGMHETKMDKDEDMKQDELKETLEALEESYKTVKHLKSVINEVNLLNAKLLYTNKLFRNFELSESQKMKVIENFDRASTTRETKLVFTTLAESFTKPAKKRVVKESYASRPSTSTAPSKEFKENTQILSEGFEHANRWKKLAGLI